MNIRADIDEVKEEIISRLQSGESRASICRWLNCKELTLQSRLKKWNVDHLKNQGGKGIARPELYADIHKHLIRNSATQSFKLKNYLFRSGLKEHKCEIDSCGISEWNGKPAPLELDHINGDPRDNRLENLRVICPNCHAQTSTYRAKNKRKK